jgi:hypothetical protein
MIPYSIHVWKTSNCTKYQPESKQLNHFNFKKGIIVSVLKMKADQKCVF